MAFQAFQADAFQQDAFQVDEYLLLAGFSAEVFGSVNVQGFNGAGVVIEPLAINPDYLPYHVFGVSTSTIAGTPNTPQTITVPYFTDTSVPLPTRVGARIACTGFTNQLFGNLTHETWKFGGTDTQAFGRTVVGQQVLLREADTRNPAHVSLTYAFGETDPPSVYAFGFNTKWGVPKLVSVAYAVGFEGTHGRTVVGTQAVLPILSTRFPSTHTTLKFPFGFSPFIEPDTFVATLFGGATLNNLVTEFVLPSESFGRPVVARYNPPTLRIRDAKNTTLKFDGVPFQFGFPKRDIFAIGIKPGVFGKLRPTSSIQVPGFDAQQIWDWSMPWVQSITQYIQWPLTSGYAGHPMVGTMGAAVMDNTGQLGLRPKGEWLGTVASTLSVTNVRKSIHPYHGRIDALGFVTDNTHEAIGTPSAAVDPDFIPAQYIRPQPFTEVFRVDGWVWPVEPRNIGPVGLGNTEAGAFVQCVLLDPDIYMMQGFQDDSYGYPLVERRLNIRPLNWETFWGAPQVTHYTRSVFQWQPWKETRFGELSFRYRTRISPSGIPTGGAFGDVHRWEENVIRLRPWVAGGEGAVSVVALLGVAGIEGWGVPDPRVSVPIYVDAFWATLMGHPPAVAYGSSLYNCGQMPRAVVPTGFPITQFGDFDAQL